MVTARTTLIPRFPRTDALAWAPERRLFFAARGIVKNWVTLSIGAPLRSPSATELETAIHKHGPRSQIEKIKWRAKLGRMFSRRRREICLPERRCSKPGARN